MSIDQVLTIAVTVMAMAVGYAIGACVAKRRQAAKSREIRGRDVFPIPPPRPFLNSASPPPPNFPPIPPPSYWHPRDKIYGGLCEECVNPGKRVMNGVLVCPNGSPKGVRACANYVHQRDNPVKSDKPTEPTARPVTCMTLAADEAAGRCEPRLGQFGQAVGITLDLAAKLAGACRVLHRVPSNGLQSCEECPLIDECRALHTILSRHMLVEEVGGKPE